MLGGVPDRRRGEHEGRVGAVVGAHPAKPTQHLGDVGPEDTAVMVTLVDHDQVERPEQPAPAVVPGEERPVEHVGVGEDVLPVLARPVALVAGGVSVVGRDPHAEPERPDRCELVLGERLGRADVERRGAALTPPSATLEDRGEGGQLVGERLAGGRTGREDDVLSGAGGLGGDGLVAPQVVDAAPPERRHHLRVRPVGPRRRTCLPTGQHAQVAEGVLAPRPLGQTPAEVGHVGASRAVDSTVRRPLHDTRHDSSLTKPTDTLGRGSRGTTSPRGAGAWFDMAERGWGRWVPHPTWSSGVDSWI